MKKLVFLIFSFFVFFFYFFQVINADESGPSVKCLNTDVDTSSFTFLINNEPCGEVDANGRFMLELKPLNLVPNAYFRVSYFYPYSGSSVIWAAKQNSNTYRNLIPYNGTESEIITATYVDGSGNPLSDARTFTINYKTDTNPPEPPQPPEPPTTGDNQTGSCVAQPAFEHVIFTVGKPLSMNQPRQNSDSFSACYFSCTDGYSGDDCSVAPECEIDPISAKRASTIDSMKLPASDAGGGSRFRSQNFDSQFPNAQIYYISPGESITSKINELGTSHPEGGFKIIIKDGTYSESASRRDSIGARFDKWVLVQAEHEYKAIIANPSNNGLNFHGAKNIILAGFEMKGNSSAKNELVLHMDGASNTAETCDPNTSLFCRCKLKAGTVECDTTQPYYQVIPTENIVIENNIIHDSYNNDLIKLNDFVMNVEIRGNMIFNQNPNVDGGNQLIDVVVAHNLTFEDNIFFDDYKGSGRGTPSQRPSAFVMVKSAYGFPSSRNLNIKRNIFLNFEGADDQSFIQLGENGNKTPDNMCQYDVEEILIENNLFLFNRPDSFRYSAGISTESAKNLNVRANTFLGHLRHSRASNNTDIGFGYAMRIYTLGTQTANENLTFMNNILSDPSGTMGNINGGSLNAMVGAKLWLNNVYFNNGVTLKDYKGQIPFALSEDTQAIIGDSKLPTNIEKGVTTPYPKNGTFSGYQATNIEAVRQEIVTKFGMTNNGGVGIDRADSRNMPARDILYKLRDNNPDIGAFELGDYTPGKSCATPPNYLNAIFTKGNPTSENVARQNTSSSAPCFYKCRDGREGDKCDADHRYPRLDYIPGGVVNGITINATPFVFKYQITDLVGQYQIDKTGAVLHYEFKYDGKTQTGWRNNRCRYIQGSNGNPDHYQTSFSISFTTGADGIQNGSCNYAPKLNVSDNSKVEYKIRATNSFGNSGNILIGSFTKGEIKTGTASCDTASKPLNYQATRYEGSPTMPNQPRQNDDPNLACYYTCKLGREGEKCDQPVYCPISQINLIYAQYLDDLKKEMGSTDSPGTERFRYKRFDAEFPNHETFYVATDGDNTKGDGTASKPFQSIAGALSALYKTHPEGGFKIEVKDGLYTSSNRVGALNFQKRVLVQAQHDYKAVIQGNNMAISFNGTDNIILAGFEMKGNGVFGYELMLHMDGHSISTGEDQDPYTDGIQTFESLGVCDPNKEFLCHCKVKNATCDPDADPAYYRVDPVKNITVENCIIHDTYNNDVIKLNDGAVNIEIRGNMIYNPREGGDQNIDVVAGYNLVFEDNIFFNDYADSGRPNSSPSANIMLKSAYGLPSTQNVDIRRNVFLNAQMKNDQPFINLGENGTAVDGLCQFDVMDVLIENNLFLHNNGDGPDAGGDQKYARYGSTIAAESVKNLLIRSNTIQGFFQHSRHGYNSNYKYNGAYNMGMGYALRMYNLGGQYGSNGSEATLGVQNENVVLTNNILADPTGRMGNITNGGPETLTGIAIIFNNVYFNGRSGASQNAQGVWSVPSGSSLRPLYEQGYGTGAYTDYVDYSILSTLNDPKAIFGDPKLTQSQELCLKTYPTRDCKNNLTSEIPYRNGTKFNGKFTASSIEGVRQKIVQTFTSLGSNSVAKDAGFQVPNSPTVQQILSSLNVSTNPNHDILYQARGDGKLDVGAFEG